MRRSIGLYWSSNHPDKLPSVRSGHPASRSARPQLEGFEDRQLLSTFLVTTPTDVGPGSLRQAILDANASPGQDTVAFQIGAGGPQTILPNSALPVVTDPVVLDGTTQPGYTGNPIIELAGTQAGALVTGLTISAGASTVRGLVINSFGDGGDRCNPCVFGGERPFPLPPPP